MAAVVESNIQWTTASPLWAGLVRGTPLTPIDNAERAAFQRPVILRFATDSFMEDLLALLEANPAQLAELQAQPESWRDPLPDLDPVQPLLLVAKSRFELRLPKRRMSFDKVTVEKPVQSLPSERPLKLFQPAHQRYYLTASCLVCQVPGLPDRVVDSGTQERVTFVVRRLFPKPSMVTLDPANHQTFDEYAWVQNGRERVWRKIGQPDQLSESEEQLPVFPVNFQHEGRKRRLFAGLIPVGKREAYYGSSVESHPSPPTPLKDNPVPTDPRIIELRAQVIEPWKKTIERAQAARTASDPPKKFNQNGQERDIREETDPPLAGGSAKQNELFKAARENIQTVSWYILLDLARFLEKHLKTVWDTIPSASLLDGVRLASADDLNQANQVVTKLATPPYMDTDIAKTLRDALSKFAGANLASLEKQLENVETPYDREKSDAKTIWPDFLFSFADPELMSKDENLDARKDQAELLAAKADDFEQKITEALKPETKKLAPAPPGSTRPNTDMREGWFVIRYVFECPTCGPLHKNLLSAPTEPFQMAAFFDPDAPARPIRVTMPMDTTPAGLRKFVKGASFAISDVLCGQIDGIGSLTLGDLVRSVLPWPLHKDLPSFKGPCQDGGLNVGMVCSLSIPIVTICAFILLIIIVSLLDYVFRWLPYFIMCFPLPGFKAKPQGGKP